MFYKRIASLNKGISTMAKTARKALVSAGKARRGSPAVARRIAAVLDQAEKAGLLGEKDSRIAGRLSSDLIAQAKSRTGIRSDSDLLAFALASVAIEDNFSAVFSRLRGAVDRAMDLEF
jgi:hypothetical protein